MPARPPFVLCLSGHDPVGGAGLHADIETLSAFGVHGLSAVTALTVQDSRNVARVVPTDPNLLAEQLNCLLADCRPDAIKLGLIGAIEQLPVIAEVLRRCAVPVVCDPVLRAGGGAELVPGSYAAALRQILLPLVTVLTPNAAEARRLAPEADDLDAAGRALLTAGCAQVLITCGDEPGPTVVNLGYQPNTAPQRYVWPRLPETFHGAGCTLASAIAARLAQGDTIAAALQRAQAWTQASLARAYAVGHGRRIPGRLP
jgi:hydroxymethylpyrimidine/phosphomethylpyrimidine kinase